MRLQGRLVEIADSGALIPEDQPERLAQAIHEFVDTFSETAQGGSA